MCLGCSAGEVPAETNYIRKQDGTVTSTTKLGDKTVKARLPPATLQRILDMEVGGKKIGSDSRCIFTRKVEALVWYHDQTGAFAGEGTSSASASASANEELLKENTELKARFEDLRQDWVKMSASMAESQAAADEWETKCRHAASQVETVNAILPKWEKEIKVFITIHILPCINRHDSFIHSSSEIMIS